MTIITDHSLGDMVYLKTDPDQYQRQIIQISIRPGNQLFYELGFNGSSGWHWEIEFSKDKDILKATS